MRATGTYYERVREHKLAYAKAYRQRMTDADKAKARENRRLRYRNDDVYREYVKTQSREYMRKKRHQSTNN